MAARSGPIDIDVPATWPIPILHRVNQLATALSGTTEHAADLDWRAQDRDEFRTLLGGRPIRAYHATRLLDHEAEMVVEHGLLLLTSELLSMRIDRAFQHGYISKKQHDELCAGHVFSTGEHKNRGGQVCLFVGEETLRHEYGLDNLLCTWGGEGIYQSSGTHHLEEKLRLLGRPTMVVVELDIGSAQEIATFSPDLWKMFVGHHLHLRGVSAAINYRASIPPQCIACLWQPGHPEYDRIERLPRD